MGNYVVLWVIAAVPEGDACFPSVSEILLSVVFLKRGQILHICHNPIHMCKEKISRFIFIFNSAIFWCYCYFSHISPCAPSCVIFYFSSTVLTFQLSPFLFFLFQSCLMGQIRANKLDPEVIGHKYNKLRDWHHDVSARVLNV